VLLLDDALVEDEDALVEDEDALLEDVDTPVEDVDACVLVPLVVDWAVVVAPVAVDVWVDVEPPLPPDPVLTEVEHAAERMTQPATTAFCRDEEKKLNCIESSTLTPIPRGARADVYRIATFSAIVILSSPARRA